MNRTRNGACKHRLPVSLRSLLIDYRMKCRNHSECGATYDYFVGEWNVTGKNQGKVTVTVSR